LAEAGTDLREIRSAVLARAIKAGDQAVEQIILRAAGYLGKAVATVVHLISPDKIVLGGGMVEAMPKLYISAVTEAARQAVMPAFDGTFKIVAAELGDEAAVLGAAAWAEHTFGDPQSA
jgi:glucokinase